uniref:p9 n=1 Tax=Simian T-lymphotropic virus 3 TaxID=39101 RepID=A0A0A7RW92_9DELA|nr:p9 [Simian T-lymphotropic virus 3]
MGKTYSSPTKPLEPQRVYTIQLLSPLLFSPLPFLQLFAAPLPALLLLFSFSPITQQLLLLLGKVIQPTLPIIRVLTTRS